MGRLVVEALLPVGVWREPFSSGGDESGWVAIPPLILRFDFFSASPLNRAFMESMRRDRRL